MTHSHIWYTDPGNIYALATGMKPPPPVENFSPQNEVKPTVDFGVLPNFKKVCQKAQPPFGENQIILLDDSGT